MENEFNIELNDLKLRLSLANSLNAIQEFILAYKEFLTKYAVYTTDGSGESKVILDILIAIQIFHKNKVQVVPIAEMKKKLFDDLIMVKFETGGFSNAGEAID